MKYQLTFLTIVAVALFGTITVQTQSNVNSDAESQAVEDTLKSFFGAISNFDYEKMRDLTSEDFTLIENGPVWTLQDLTDRVKGKKTRPRYKNYGNRSDSMDDLQEQRCNEDG